MRRDEEMKTIFAFHPLIPSNPLIPVRSETLSNHLRGPHGAHNIPPRGNPPLKGDDEEP
jgi:hypothetical protein